MSRHRIRSLMTGLTVIAVLAGTITPALADHKGETHGQQEVEEENFQEADNSASKKGSSPTTKRGKPTPEEEESSTTSTSSESTTAESQSTATDEEADGPGKNWDNEGTERGETSTDCKNTHGGTGSGRVYDSTCDGSGSKAGNGSGDGGGRPCAGCVGNADYKEPAGQLKDGDHDGNAGYECDGNNGVARSNPAHTSCKLPTPPPPPPPLCPPGTDLSGLPVPPEGCDLEDGELCPPGSDREGMPPGPHGCNDRVLNRIDKVCPEGTDLAGRDMTNVKDCVLGTRFHSGPPDEPLGAVLPFTGSTGLSLFITIGMLLMAAGLASLRLRKSA